MNFAMFSSRLGLFSSSLLKTHTGLVFYRWVRIETKRKEESGRVLKWASSAYSLLKPIYEEIRHLGLVWKKKHKTLPRRQSHFNLGFLCFTGPDWAIRC